MFVLDETRFELLVTLIMPPAPGKKKASYLVFTKDVQMHFMELPKNLKGLFVKRVRYQ